MSSLLISLPIQNLPLLLLIASFSFSSGQPSFWGYNCGKTGNYTKSSAFATNLNTFLSSIISGIQFPSVENFYELTTGTKPGEDLVIGSATCRGDLSSSDCHSCFTDAAGAIQQVCPTQKQAIGFYRDCTIKYSDRPMSGSVESSPMLAIANPANASHPEAFNGQLMLLLGSVQAKTLAARGRMRWATGSRRANGSESVYALLQCSPDLKDSDCSDCLKNMINFIPTHCYGKTGCSIFAPNCGSRFDVYQFYRSGGDHLSPPPSLIIMKGKSRRKRKSFLKPLLSVSIPTFVAILLVVRIWICRRRRKARQTANTVLIDEVVEIVALESLQFDLATIKAATSNFALENKLGEGGFGEVYKGKLGSGQQIATKRLSKNSGQGIAEFKNELVLVAKLQHKNLVKLLGFCLAPDEKILIYEFVSNLSLDRFLFDPAKNMLLNWETRFKIILGIARGLLYLHEDSRLKVVHRDLKTSNILLDEAMNPKISDFGLARLFGVDETQVKTKRIVGTYGYMAPEYAITGHFSVKSDVFSFGVMVLEIVSGQKNRYFARPQVEEALLYRAWRLWNDKNILDLVDPTLEKKYSEDEVRKCIHVAILCIQEDPIERPRMASIVAALNGDSISLPMPSAPQFFGNSRGISRTSNNMMFLQALGNEIEEHEAYSSYSGTKNITSLYPR